MNSGIHLTLQAIYDNLPLHAEEGGESTIVNANDLACQLDGLEHATAATGVDFVQRLFCMLGLLDENMLQQNQWRFVSFPASLLARSLLKSLADTDQSLFSNGFWLPQDSSSPVSDQQRSLLHALESQRLSYHKSQAAPVRYVHVAWGLIVVDGKVLLRHREDATRKNIGNYVLVGGRLSQQDLREAGEEQALSVLQSPAASDNIKAIEVALMREMQEETGLNKVDAKTGYSYSRLQSIKPFIKVEGAGANHALTEYRIHLFNISLSQQALFQLYERINTDANLCWVSLEELGEGTSHDGKAIFLDAIFEHFGGQENWADIVKTFPVSYLDESIIDEDASSITLPNATTQVEMGRTGKEKRIDLGLTKDDVLLLVALKLIADRHEPTERPHGIELLGSGWVRILDGELKQQLKTLTIKLADHQLPVLKCVYEDYYCLNIVPTLAYLAGDYFNWTLNERVLTVTRHGIATPLGKFEAQRKSISISERLANELTTYTQENPNPIYQVEDFMKVARRDITDKLKPLGFRAFARKINNQPVLAISYKKSA